MWLDLIRALALVAVIEGLAPFVAPERWRAAMLRLADMPAGQLRIGGAVAIAIGVVVLQLIHQF
ncbi:DUF2065 domain-containing protein [Salinisphaera sp. Q1T1-3]|uniref:DUF2065 domain-containing protein n=1 Tax=Salinisphaera sp. Q1T1-3 TaxID=2321229 RepID=UPI000E758A15|nr:DUF2065 domain-containing protein [Salinisphaera sp. Q1T1-3]RJS93796.1 DUF2065 domain-containing protein [Salinisphaera sp. Q1T1-3]